MEMVRQRRHGSAECQGLDLFASRRLCIDMGFENQSSYNYSVLAHQEGYNQAQLRSIGMEGIRMVV